MVDKDAMASGDRAVEEEAELDLKEGAPGEPDPEMALPPPEDPSDGQTKTARTWELSVVFLCFYGFMVQLKPGEPFITPNLLSMEKNFTREQVSDAQSSPNNSLECWCGVFCVSASM